MSAAASHLVDDGGDVDASEHQAERVWGTAAKPLPDWFRAKRGGGNRLVGAWVPIVLVGIPLAVILAIVVYPTVWMFYHAFHNTNMMSLFSGNWQPVGFDNFAYVLSSDRFQESVLNLSFYLTFGATMQVLLGTALALIIYEVVRPRWLQTLVLILLVLPMMMPPSIAGTLWKFLLQANNGAFNHLLINLGLMASDQRIEWFSVDLSLISLVIADTWQWTALPLLIVYSGRVSLPPAIYEAARVDGASAFQVLTRLTLPMLREIIAIAFILRFMDAYKFVDKVYVMTSGGPAQASELPVYIAFQKGIREFQIGEAAAYAIIIFAFAAILITLFLQYLKRVMRHQGVTS